MWFAISSLWSRPSAFLRNLLTHCIEEKSAFLVPCDLDAYEQYSSSDNNLMLPILSVRTRNNNEEKRQGSDGRHETAFHFSKRALVHI